MPRVWTGKEDIRKITKEARAAVCCYNILSACVFVFFKMIMWFILHAGSEDFICNGCHTSG